MAIVFPTNTPIPPADEDPFCSRAQILTRYDARTIGELVQDENRPIPRDQLLTNGNLLVALQDAAGAMRAAFAYGNRYTLDDLQDLTGLDLSLLIRINADITMLLLYERRPLFSPDMMKAAMENATKWLEQLRSGDMIFSIPGTAAASVVTVDGPTEQDYKDLNLVRDRSNRYFPRRINPNNR